MAGLVVKVKMKPNQSKGQMKLPMKRLEPVEMPRLSQTMTMLVLTAMGLRAAAMLEPKVAVKTLTPAKVKVTKIHQAIPTSLNSRTFRGEISRAIFSRPES